MKTYDVQWYRGEEGCSVSRTTNGGHYEIEAMYNHSTRPAWYRLYWYKDGEPREDIGGWCDTVREAKEKADRHWLQYPTDDPVPEQLTDWEKAMLVDALDLLARHLPSESENAHILRGKLIAAKQVSVTL